MTAIYVIGALVIGFLLGDRRGVRECNATLDSNMKVLLGSITDERTIPAEADAPLNPRPTVH